MADDMTRQEVVDFIKVRLDPAFNAMEKAINEIDDVDINLDLIEGMTCLLEIRNCFPDDKEL